MKGKTFLVALFLFVALFVMPNVGAPAQAQTYTMKIACDTLNDVQNESVKLLGERIAKRSGGRIKTEIFPGGQLGSTQRIIDGIQLGTIEAYVVPAANFVSVDPRFQVLAAPGWFKKCRSRVSNDQRPAVSERLFPV